MDEAAALCGRAPVRYDEMDDGLSSVPPARTDQGKGRARTHRTRLQSQTHHHHSRGTGAAPGLAADNYLRGDNPPFLASPSSADLRQRQIAETFYTAWSAGMSGGERAVLWSGQGSVIYTICVD